MILLTSGGYLNPGLASEFGKIPSSFLPLKNVRLFEHQFQYLKKHLKGHNIYISLPNNYKINSIDLSIIENYNVTIIRTDPKFNYGKSLHSSLQKINKKKEPLIIMNGDTLFLKFPKTNNLDYTFVGDPEGNYNWDYIPNKKQIYLGFFCFKDQDFFHKLLKFNNYSLIKSINSYLDKYPDFSFIKVKKMNWLDFGILNLYYVSKSKFTTERSFNNLLFKKYSVLKSSNNKKKLKAELNWYESLPQEFIQYIPRIWNFYENNDYFTYEIENFYQPSLSELLLYSEHPEYVWKDIFESIFEFTVNCFKCKTRKKLSNKFSDFFYSVKTKKRINLINKKNLFDIEKQYRINGQLTPSLKNILIEIEGIFNEKSSNYQSIIHGDLCFSNILYDFKSKSVKLIDPKGLLNNTITIYGDLRYDIAKLSHSVIGLYDFIIAERFKLIEKNKYDIIFKIEKSQNLINIQNLFLESNLLGRKISNYPIYPIMIHLFISMIPLHNDSEIKQKAFFYNALRLYIDFKKKECK